MTKHFCDKCGQELKDNNYTTSLKNGQPLPNLKELQHPLREFYFCSKCLKEVQGFITGKNN